MLQKPHLFYEPQLFQHGKKYTFTTQPKTLLTIQIFKQTCFCLGARKKIFQLRKNCILEALGKTFALFVLIQVDNTQ